MGITAINEAAPLNNGATWPGGSAPGRTQSVYASFSINVYLHSLLAYSTDGVDQVFEYTLAIGGGSGPNGVFTVPHGAGSGAVVPFDVLAAIGHTDGLALTNGDSITISNVAAISASPAAVNVVALGGILG